MATSDVNPLECSICLEKFKNPRLISCHHSFCFKCLDDFIKKTSKNNKFNCPVCRKEVEIPPGGVCEFSANFYINTKPSDNIPESKIAVEGLSGNAQEPEKYFCEKHPKKEVDFFCVDCNVVACSKCIFSTHKTHKLLDLDEDETRQKYLKKLSHIKSKLEVSNKRNKQLIVTAGSDARKLSVQAEQEIQKIRDRVDEICTSVYQNGENMVTKILKHLNSSKKELKDSISGIELYPASLKEDISNTLKNGSSVVNLIKTTQRAIDAIHILSKKVVLPLSTNIKFKISNGCVPPNVIGIVRTNNDQFNQDDDMNYNEDGYYHDDYYDDGYNYNDQNYHDDDDDYYDYDFDDDDDYNYNDQNNHDYDDDYNEYEYFESDEFNDQ